MPGFEDLLPSELAGRRGPAPMRPGGSPPRAPAPAAVQATAQATPPAVEPVDGVPDATVDAWFAFADADGDGRVADSEARDFFLTSGLAPADLSKIWKLVKSPEVIAREGKGLSRHRFAQVLRLIALAQSSSFPFTQENATAALHRHTWMALHGVALPAPHLAAAGAGEGAAGVPPQPQAAVAAAADDGREAQQAATPAPAAQQRDAAGPSLAAAADAPAAGSVDALFGDGLLGSVAAAGPDTAAADDDDLFGLRALQQRHGAPAGSAAEGAAAAEQEGEAPEEGLVRRLSRSQAVSHRESRKGGLVRIATNDLEPPVAFVARLPPLQPKVSAKLTLLAAGNGSLFAGPAVNGGLLQWGRPEGNLRRPLDVEGNGPQGQAGGHRLNRLMSDLMFTYTAEQHVGTEDSDAAPAIEVAATEKGRTTACLLVDEPAQLLWVADKDGWVYAYDIGGEPGLSLRAGHRVYAFQAHRVGHVTAMVRTPQGELWTGSSRGYIRVWELGEPALVGEAPAPPRCRELRKGYGERPHSGAVLALACPADGQVVWSASQKGLLLWDAACGAFLGALQRGPARSGGGGANSPDLVPASGAADNSALRYKVDPSKGLEVDPLTGYIVARPTTGEWPRIGADQEGWAAQTDNNINELMERVSIGGSKVVQGAGKAVKLLGKLLGGGGDRDRDRGAQEAPSVPSAARSSSYGSMSLPATASVALPDDDASVGGDRERSEGSVGAIVALLAPPDGSVWVGHASGTVDRYTPAGRRLGTEECGSNLTAAACVGRRVWLGFSDGMLSVRSGDGASLKLFQAHTTGILSIAQAGSRTYTLAADGSIKGWSSAVPHAADDDALVAWDEEAVQTFRRESLRVLAVTWNVGESKPEPGSPFFRWVHEAAFPTQLVVVGLQEIEMGSSSVALAAAKDAFSQRMQERGNTNAKFWSAGLLEALGGERHWHQVGLRQLSGMLVMVFARNHLRDDIGEVTTASVACGVLGVGGNKGAVAVEFSVHRRKIAVVCSHFAAHQGALEARNANYTTICRQLTFISRAWFEEEAPAAAPGARGKLGLPTLVAAADSADAGSDDGDSSSVGAGDLAVPPSPTAPAAEEVMVGEGMRGAQMLVWLGDFNYRIDGAYESVKERAIRNELGPLLELDQCRREMAAGRVFRGLREGPITFRPTYKFDKASANPFGYDTSEKRRIPAWCDRIFFRGSQPFPTPEPQEGESTAAPVHEEDDVTVAPLEYNCWADVTDSDHKPVYAVLEANLPITDQAKKRAICSRLLKCCSAAALGRQVDEEGRAEGEVAPPAVSLQPDHVKLHQEAMPRQMVLLRNDGPQPLLFTVAHDLPAAGLGGELRRRSDDDESAAAAAQQLLEVRPVRGVVPPGQDVQLQVHISGDEWALRGALHNPRLRYRVRLGSELSSGGESTDPCAAELTFSAECLTRL